MYHFNPQEDIQTKYIVFAGPGGSGKTSAACAAAVSLADHGHRTLFHRNRAHQPICPSCSIAADDTDHHGSCKSPSWTSAIDPLQDFEHVFLQLEQFLMDPENRFRYSYVIADIWDTEWMLQELRSPLFSDHHELMDVLTDPSQTSAFLVSRPLTTEFCKTAQAVQRLRSIGITNLLLLVNSLALRDDGAAAASFTNYSKRRSQRCLRFCTSFPHGKFPCVRIPSPIHPVFVPLCERTTSHHLRRG